MSSIRTTLAEFTGEHQAHVQAKMIDFDGPVGVEGFVDGNQVIGVYEGPDRVAFVMGNGTSGYLASDGEFDYRKGGPQVLRAPAVFALPPELASDRTADMIRREIQSLFAMSNQIDVLDWCTPD